MKFWNSPGQRIAGPCLLLALIALHGLSIALDPAIRFFLGDSATYLVAATDNWLPPDRSSLYPLLIRWLVLPFHSLQPLLWWQSAATIAIAMFSFGVLRRSFGMNAWLAAGFGLLIGVGPELLFFSRMAMAENFGLLALVGMLAAGMAYVRYGKPAWLLVVAVLSLAVVCLRMSLLPVALGMSVLPVLVRLFGDRQPGFGGWLRGAVHLLLAAAAVMAVHTGYKIWYTDQSGGGKRDYIKEAGYFRLSLVTPLVQPEDLRELGLPADFHSRYPTLADPREREAQLWLPTGIVAGLKEQLGYEGGNRAARKIAARAVRRDPAGLFRLARVTVADYFDTLIAQARILDDTGVNAIDAGLAQLLRARFDHDGSTVHEQRGPFWQAYVGSRLWFTFCLFALAPLALLMVGLSWRSRWRVPALLLGLSSIGLTAAQMLFSHIPSFRYLLPFPTFFWLCAAVSLAMAGRWFATRGEPVVSA